MWCALGRGTLRAGRVGISLSHIPGNGFEMENSRNKDGGGRRGQGRTGILWGPTKGGWAEQGKEEDPGKGSGSCDSGSEFFPESTPCSLSSCYLVGRPLQRRTTFIQPLGRGHKKMQIQSLVAF